MERYDVGDFLQNNPCMGMGEYVGHELIILQLGDEYLSSFKKKFLTLLQTDKKKRQPN